MKKEKYDKSDRLRNDFFFRMQERYELGGRKYGLKRYLNKEPERILCDAEEELIDLANYSAFCYEKLQFLKEKINYAKKRI